MNEVIADRYVALITQLKTKIEADSFLKRHRRSEKDFTRKPILSFVTVILFLLNRVKRALQDELDEYFKMLQGEPVATREVSKSAFTQARRKFKHTAFIELNQEQVTHFYEHFEPHRWHGKRLLGVDGSMATLPRIEEIANHFGVWRPHTGGYCPKARVSQLFDVLNKVTVEAVIAPKENGERVLAATHCQNIGVDDLLLLDRGYPAFWLFALIVSKQADFCARVAVGTWKCVADFVKSGKQEVIITLLPSAQAKKKCKELALPLEPLTVRLLRIELPSGEVEVLITSLLDTTAFPHDLFQALYHQRWPVEEDYKSLKLRLEVENWSGKTVESIYQDFHAAIFTKNLTAILAQPAQTVVEQHNAGKKHRYQINMTNLISKMKDTLVLLFSGFDPAPFLAALWQQMVCTIEPIRSGRSYKRKKTVRRKRFAMNYKPTR